MWKTVVLISIVLTTVIGGMLFWQWKAYSKQYDSTNETSERAMQEITVKSKENELMVNQRITGVTSGKEYKVIKPDSLYRFTCVNSNNNPCKSTDDNSFSVIPEQNEIIFEYSIPIKQKQKAFLLEEWTAKIPEVSLTESSIIIVDSVKRGGTWVAGAQMKGFKEMDLIDYYYFEAMGSAPALYWQSVALQKTESSKIHYFSMKESNQSFKVKELENLINYPFTAVIFTDLHKEQASKGILVSKPNLKAEALKRKMIHYYYEKKFTDLPTEQEWLLDALTSYSAKLPARTEKGKEILQELKDKLTEDEVTKFFQLVNDSSTPLTFINLDNYISQIRGLNTRFFALNGEKPQSLTSLYFYDSRNVKINNEVAKGIEVIYEEGKSLFPFNKTMKALGYKIDILPDQETILLVKGTNTFRFFLNKNIFIYNEDDYGLLEKPLSTINGNIYMSKQWMETLFKVSIEDEEQEILIGIEE